MDAVVHAADAHSSAHVAGPLLPQATLCEAGVGLAAAAALLASRHRRNQDGRRVAVEARRVTRVMRCHIAATAGVWRA